MIRIVVVDDHPVVRRGLISMLTGEEYGISVVGEADSGAQAVEMALAQEPDVIVMDMHMPGISGLEAITEIRKRQPSARILVLTSFGEDERVAAALRAGALGYLLKDSSPDELVNAIRSVAGGHLSIPQQLAVALLRAQLGVALPPDEKLTTELTAREIDVLRCLANGASNKEIAVELALGLTTVRTHISSILRKLGMENRTQAALFAREHGLLE